MTPITAEDHARAARLYNEKSQGHELDRYDRQFLYIYEARKKKIAKVSNAFSSFKNGTKKR